MSERIDDASQCMQTAYMANVMIRNVPDEVHSALRDRAARAGLSLQQYLQAELARLATQPTMADVLDRIEARSRKAVSFGFDQAVADLAQERP